jgi:hypothetical protein
MSKRVAHPIKTDRSATNSRRRIIAVL